MNALLEVALQILAGILLVVGTYAIARLAAWLKLGTDDKFRAYLNQALERGIDLAIANLRARLPSYGRPAPPELAELIGHVADYAAARVPDALTRFGVGDQGLRDMIAARLATRFPAGSPAIAPASVI